MAVSDDFYDPARADRAEAVTTPDGRDQKRGRRYRPTRALADAVNTALAMERPLLVSGEPGCGKTELGFAIARNLGLETLYFFTVKSTSSARDLFYDYDAISRFQSAQIEAARNPADAAVTASDFLRYAALGRAIMDAHEEADIDHLKAGDYVHPGEPARSVVVIDEIDKAPRDFPNDLLVEIDRLAFRVPELAAHMPEGREPSTPNDGIAPGRKPIVIITSNSERQLPDAFLRRCAYHHIEFPDPELLTEILLDRVRDEAGGRLLPDEFVDGAVDFVMALRARNLEKPPGTAELINFLTAVCARGDGGGALKQSLARDKSAMAKTTPDSEKFDALLAEWGPA